MKTKNKEPESPKKELRRHEPEAYSLRNGVSWSVYLSMTRGPLATSETEDQAWEKALAKYYIDHPKLKS